jgi:hypothetical protein
MRSRGRRSIGFVLVGRTDPVPPSRWPIAVKLSVLIGVILEMAEFGKKAIA